MDYSEFKKYTVFFKECGVNSLDNFILKCSQLQDLLNEHNRKLNLTALSTEEDFWNKHVADSLSILRSFPLLQSYQYRIIDLGSGAGFPGLLMAIAKENLKVTLIDSTSKKIEFINHIIKTFNLNNADTLCARGREIKQPIYTDYIVGRAVGNASKIYKETKHILKKNKASLILYKTPKAINNELPAVKNSSKKDNFYWELSKDFNLPNGERRIFFIGGFR